MEYEIHTEMKCNLPYRELRNNAIQKLGNDYTLEELYKEIEKQSELENYIINEIYSREMHLEGRLLSGRKRMLECVAYAEYFKKEIYIISDMYLPKNFYSSILRKYGLNIGNENILISSERKKSKRQGDLWKWYAEEIVKGKKALHIGDDPKADVEIPQKYGITAYHAASQIELLRWSSIREVESGIVNTDISQMTGILLNKIFNDPFAVNAQKGKIMIEDASTMGYVVFGPIIFIFLSWIMEQAKEDQIKKMVFMSRDGYFLRKDYEYYCTQVHNDVKSCYIGISRQLAMLASIQSDSELWNFVSMPYSGSPVQLLEDRFNIRASAEEQNLEWPALYAIYKNKIWEYVRSVRKNYLNYLKNCRLDDDCAMIDLGYYGNNQRFLNKLTSLHMKGYYFNADLSEQNGNFKKNLMKACFQNHKDSKGTESKILKNMIVIESFLTAPYGMVKEIDEYGNWICAESCGNQKRFAIKEKINEGVKQYIRDCCAGGIKVSDNLSREFVDYWYGLCLTGKMEFSEEIKKSFYNDNAMMNRIESLVFY
ncbi:MAG: hypothetical protein NC434_02130 [Ruminococcus sp.]|nr:hypothetical protein [Ruminococcus sp.]